MTFFLHSYQDTYSCFFGHFHSLPGVDDITSTSSNDEEVTEWLKSLFLFAAVWSLGGTITGDSRVKFDEFFRSLTGGKNSKYPVPKAIALNRSHLFPEKGGELSPS